MKMSTEQAAKILGLTGEQTAQSIKRAYREACKKFHPDRNPMGEDMMKTVNEAYEALKDFSGVLKNTEADYGDKYNDILNALSALNGIIIELCGTWIWVTGETKQHKDVLGKKGLGLKFANKKKAWHYRPAEYKSFSRGKYSLDQIRENHGSIQINRSQRTIAA